MLVDNVPGGYVAQRKTLDRFDVDVSADLNELMSAMRMVDIE